MNKGTHLLNLVHNDTKNDAIIKKHFWIINACPS